MTTAIAITVPVLIYLAGILYTARRYANANYKYHHRTYSTLQYEYGEGVFFGLLAGIFWPATLPVRLLLDVGQGGGAAKRFLFPDWAAKEAHAIQVAEWREKAMALRVQAAELSDEPLIAKGLRDLADEYSRMAKS